MPDEFATETAALGTEVRHWRRACAGLGELEVAASTQAWNELESYLGLSVRSNLAALAKRLAARADRIAFTLGVAQTPTDLKSVRAELLDLRRRYRRAEAVVDFFGDAVNTRTNPRTGAVLRGLDALAVHSMDQVLRPLGIDTPPVLTYLDKGMGASILRAGARLWDSSISPAAAIKITRHNLWQPTSLVHETGHQVAHLTGWTAELGTALRASLAQHDQLSAEAWQSWASEVAADTYAFCLLGYAPVPALATVVDGPTRAVFRMPLGDPHPFALLRVLFNVALCRSWFRDGPWDALGARWIARHPLAQAPSDVAAITSASLAQLGAIVDVCTRRPMAAFNGVSLSALVDPRRVSPQELERFTDRAGPSLYTSSYLQRIEPMRILALTVLRGLEAPAAPTHLETWLRRLGGDRSAAA
ncbi:hypothetical protein [Rhodococcus tukisamuensis]|uniref:Uncharacterized protein n=1 Tax=Rhodococcus tukisamuensis TaxID=168276 RepID=A0A1G6RE38_9NOCA|nr:hypothetical protein [Rhodococcus tukisamuensis]SDD02663.1 hypothetical protein SAMN05444580_102432 [Rhodococcus tukisamuensis]